MTMLNILCLKTIPKNNPLQHHSAHAWDCRIRSGFATRMKTH